MLWFLRDYPFAALLLRAATLAFDSILMGGLFFCCLLLRGRKSDVSAFHLHGFHARAAHLLRLAALGLIVTQALFLWVNSAMLLGTAPLRLADLVTSNYFLAGLVLIAGALPLLVAGRRLRSLAPGWAVLLLPLLAAIMATSHSASRLQHRVPLVLLTGLHQLAVALWVGGMPFFWLLLADAGPAPLAADPESLRIARRYSTLSLVSVLVLIAAGLLLAWRYTQSWSAVYGTAYGVVLITKSILLAGLLLLGAGNFLLLRGRHLHLPSALLRIARFSEGEIAIGFTIILAAASLTAQPPAVDLTQNRLTLPEIAARFTPRLPRLTTPPVSALPPVQPMAQAMRQYAAAPDDANSANNRVEQAWSEYNHHWAGIVVLLAGILAMLSRWPRAAWARHWPLAFLGLAVFLLLRADPEAWPLGPRGFWASFYNPEDLQHRLFILLIVSFVAFEWSIQTRRLASARAALVFPAVCILGGAVLLGHQHSLGNEKEELLVQISHTGIAICAIFAGVARWLQVRSRSLTGRFRAIAAWVWPVCLTLIGLILLNYRES